MKSSGTTACELFDILKSFGIKHSFEYVKKHNQQSIIELHEAARYVIEWSTPPRHNRSSPFIIKTKITHYYNSLAELPLAQKDEEVIYDLVNRYVNILDVDKERKHVYVEVKNFTDLFVDNTDNTNHVSYYLMGKIDDRNCFMMNLTNIYNVDEGSLKTVKHCHTINDIYRYSNKYPKCDKMGKDGKKTCQSDNSYIKRKAITCFITENPTRGGKKALLKYQEAYVKKEKVQLDHMITSHVNCLGRRIGKLDLTYYTIELKSWSSVSTSNIHNAHTQMISHPIFVPFQ